MHSVKSIKAVAETYASMAMEAAPVGNKRGSGGYSPEVHGAHAATDLAYDLTDHAETTKTKADHEEAAKAHMKAAEANAAAKRSIPAKHHRDQAEYHSKMAANR